MALVCAVACSGVSFIESQAVKYVRSQYSDFDRLIMCDVDTVTLGDNLDYRIEQARRNLEFASMMVRDHGGDYAQKEQEKEMAWVAALDSLKAVSGSVLNEPTAYNCCVAYNNPDNLVWVQLDKYGNLLAITKDKSKDFLLNPGEDVPGYLDVWRKYRK